MMGKTCAMYGNAYLWVDEWARVEELWDLEEAWLAGNDPSVAGRMTLSVAGTFFDMYCANKMDLEGCEIWKKDMLWSYNHIWKHLECIQYMCVNFNNIKVTFRNSHLP